jgi:hypothetical protein
MKKTPKVLIATPMYGGMCTGTYTGSILQIYKKFNELGWDVDVAYLMNHSIITKARNTLSNIMLYSDFTHLLFIDADVCVKPEDVVKMVEANKAVIGGLYPLKEINWERVAQGARDGVPAKHLSEIASGFVFNVHEGDSLKLTGNFGLREVKHVGTGYMLIKKRVFEKLSEVVPSYINNQKVNFFGIEEPDQTKEFFAFSITENGKYLSEDYYFCDKWLSLGEKIYLAEWAYATHTGTYVFGS